MTRHAEHTAAFLNDMGYDGYGILGLKRPEPVATVERDGRLYGAGHICTNCERLIVSDPHKCPRVKKKPPKWARA